MDDSTLIQKFGQVFDSIFTLSKNVNVGDKKNSDEINKVDSKADDNTNSIIEAEQSITEMDLSLIETQQYVTDLELELVEDEEKEGDK